jgi:hypothetical protein
MQLCAHGDAVSQVQVLPARQVELWFFEPQAAAKSATHTSSGR